MLRKLGLDFAASRLYEVALDNPNLTVFELAELAMIPVPTALKACHTLTELGIASEQGERFRVVSLRHAIDLIVARQDSELAACSARVADIRERAQRLKSEISEPTANDVEIVRGATVVNDYLGDLCRETTFQMDTFAPGGALGLAAIQGAKFRNQEMYDRGVHSRSIYLDSIRRDHKTLSYVEWISGRGAEVRCVSKLPTRMIISDHRIAVLPADFEDATNAIAIFRMPSVVAALRELFEFTWAKASPIGPSPIVSESGLTEIERVIFELLSHGKSDEAVGKKLGLSARTVRRRIKGVVDRLGVNTRKEAIYVATKNNWI